jgi:hypothetical protein
MLDPAFVADCPYLPSGLMIDEIVEIDAEASRLVARVPTHDDLPLTRDQRADPQRHPRHVNGGLMIHLTGMVGFAHAYFILGLRHAEGWIGYGTHVHTARFRRMGKIGPPIVLACRATSVRRIRGAIVARYEMRFRQDDDVIYEGDQSAIWSRLEP